MALDRLKEDALEWARSLNWPGTPELGEVKARLDTSEDQRSGIITVTIEVHGWR